MAAHPDPTADEDAIRRRHERFLAELHDDLRQEGDAATVLRETTRRLAEHMGASRTGYGEFNDDASLFIPRDHWTDGTVVSIDEPIAFAAFGPAITASHGRGELWVHETLDDPKLDAAGREACRALGIVAVITVPILKGGRLRSLISVQQSRPHRWHPADVALVAELGDRTWSALERIRSEEARQETEELLGSIMRHAPIGIYLKDAEGRFRLVNDAMARFSGHAPAAMIGRREDELFDADTAAASAAADAAAITGDRAETREVAGPPGGAVEHGLAMRFPVATRRGTELAGFQIDVSDRRRAEAELARSKEALHQAEKLHALGSLLAGVSHELNNPLSIIIAQAELLERDAAGTRIAERAGKIRLAAERSGRIVQTFLAMARQKQPRHGAVRLDQVATAALDLAVYGIRTSGIAVVTELPAELPPVAGDADQLHQVVVNLLVNAQHAMEGHPRPRTLSLVAGLCDSQAHVFLEVADTGPGIPPALRGRIFEPFFTTKAQGAGTGIGLSFSQGIVEAHGGTLTLVDGDHEGARFRLELPVAAPDTGERATPPSSTGAGPALRRALIVDDEPDVAESLGELLGGFGFSVEIAMSGEAAKAVLAVGGFDLVVTDLRMPDVDGPALFGWLRSHRPDLVDAVAFSTGDTLSETAAAFLAASDRPYMEKPFTVSAIAHLVEAVARRRGGQRMT